ncbi:DUF1552 domain-containing protein [Archangium sp.]|uniref:DUF1552 domain-containing protein n=1 Tax=Archangium sp. TaxID=1872627 RepID=UPI00286A7DDD|nr:DUF1552 domain-containing protein [Archangium sp.]
MSGKRLLSRRSLLTGLGGAALSLPLLEGVPHWLNPLRSAHAAPAGRAPLRFLVMWTPNGTIPEHWTPTGTETAFRLSPILEPLTPHQGDILILDGLDALSAYKGPGDAHQKATGQCLTGTELQEGTFAGADGHSAGWANGISVDQAIANHVGNQTRLRSLELGVFVSGANINSRISYRGPAQPLPPENRPRAAFEHLFGDPSETPAARAERVARRKSVLDSVTGRYQSLLPKLSTADRLKVEQHLTALREIEQRLDTNPVLGCQAPARPRDVAVDNLDNIPELGRLQMDMLVSALACDLTRVGTLMWMNSATDKTYPWLGIHEGHHELSHRGDTDLDAKTKLTKIYRWYAEQFAYLLAKLKSVPEGNGTMLDNTLVVWISEHSKGNVHDRRGLPYVAAGRAGGAVRPGRWVRYTGEVPHNNLWVSCLNMFGVPATTFGNPAYCTGPLGRLT